VEESNLRNVCHAGSLGWSGEGMQMKSKLSCKLGCSEEGKGIVNSAAAEEAKTQGVGAGGRTRAKR
jgi:hypothetical protein